jgi:hypothetical protein
MKIIHVILCAPAVLAAISVAHAGPSEQTGQGTRFSIESDNGDGPEKIVPRQRATSGKSYLLSTNRWSEMML